MKKALLVIDMQEVCVGVEHAAFFKYESTLIDTVNQVIDANKENIVVYIRNVMKKNLINKLAPFQAYEGSKEVELAENLHIISEHVFDKYEGNAFSNSQFAEFLKARDVDVVEIVGVDGGGCVAATAMGACESGYKVIIHTKAVGTMFEDKAKKYKTKLLKMDVEFL